MFMSVLKGSNLVLVWLPQTPPQVPTPNTVGCGGTTVFRDTVSTVNAFNVPETYAVCAGFAGMKLYTYLAVGQPSECSFRLRWL